MRFQCFDCRGPLAFGYAGLRLLQCLCPEGYTVHPSFHGQRPTLEPQSPDHSAPNPKLQNLRAQKPEARIAKNRSGLTRVELLRRGRVRHPTRNVGLCSSSAAAGIITHLPALTLECCTVMKTGDMQTQRSLLTARVRRSHYISEQPKECLSAP